MYIYYDRNTKDIVAYGNLKSLSKNTGIEINYLYNLFFRKKVNETCTVDYRILKTKIVVSKSFVCGCNDPDITWYGNDDDKKYFCFTCKKEAN